MFKKVYRRSVEAVFFGVALSGEIAREVEDTLGEILQSMEALDGDSSPEVRGIVQWVRREMEETRESEGHLKDAVRAIHTQFYSDWKHYGYLAAQLRKFKRLPNEMVELLEAQQQDAKMRGIARSHG